LQKRQRGVSRRGETAVLTVLLVVVTGSAPAGEAASAEHRHMQLVGHHDLQHRGAYQPVIQQQGGRWIAYIGHHAGSAINPLTGKVETNGTSIVDVTDPARPRYLHHLPGSAGAQMVQTCRGAELPVNDDRTYLLRSNGNESQQLWDVTEPMQPRLVSTPLSGGHATHKNWWDCKSGIAYLVYDGRQRGWRTGRLLWVMDLGDPARPELVRRFGLPGHEPDSPSAVAPPGAHEATLSPDGDRLFIAYGTGSHGVMQIVDVATLLGCRPGCPASPTARELLAPQIGRLHMPRFWGGHTAWPIMAIEVPEQSGFVGATPRDFVVLVSESFADRCLEDGHDMVFLVDVTDPAVPFPVANYQVAETSGDFCKRGGRFGAHSTNWSYHPRFYRRMIFISYFNAGVRAVDIRDPFHPVEAGYYIPAGAAIQTNNVELDGRGLIYLVDRDGAGLHIVTLTGPALKVLE
jgi:hypothetical protein